MSTQVYWIRAAHHSDITSEGYVGVSKNSNKRLNKLPNELPLDVLRLPLKEELFDANLP